MNTFVPSCAAVALLQRAKRGGFLESWDVLDVTVPNLQMADDLVRKALADPALIQCEQNDWLERVVAPMREPPVFWKRTALGDIAAT